MSDAACHQYAIQRMCQLQEKVAARLDLGAADCFCGEGGFWKTDKYDGSYEGGYRNDFEVIEFIEAAVREKLNLEDDSG